MITSAAEQMGKALGSNNHSMGDWISNISSMLMGITILLPSMISLTKSIYSGTQKLITNTKATIANIIAKRAEKINIKDIVFDRGGYIYHGVVKEVAEAAREGGLNF